MKIFFRIALIFSLFPLAACSILPDLGSPAVATGAAPAANALTPTPELSSFRQGPVQACTLATLSIIATSSDQGSLAAWSPDGRQIAYVKPPSTHNMFSGSLVVASAPDYAPSAPLAQNVTGSVTWSPAGDMLAFVSLRSPDNAYTVMTTNLTGTVQSDLFAGSSTRLDNYSSPKAILSWPEGGELRVLAACGLGCVQMLALSVPGGAASQLPTPEPTALAASWAAPRNVQKYDASAYPQMNDPNWSADGKWVVYFDQDGYLWVLQIKEKTAFQLSMTGDLLPVFLRDTWNRETHWGPGGKLAVRVGNSLELFSIPCNK
ncbi:MAG TPA: hypothetical protein VF498_12930 [Anaerolineales bacterium]